MTAPYEDMSRRFIAFIGLLMSAPALLASLWENPDWAVTSQDSLGVGYDSNLYDRNGGAGDGYVLVSPGLTLKRLASFTDLEVNLGLQSYTYINLRSLDSVDPSLNIVARYPYDVDEGFPTEQVTLLASRTTEVNALVGGRLRREDLGAQWEGNLAASEKTILLGRLNLHDVDYLTTGFNDNEYASGGLTLAYLASERLELGIGYDYSYSDSRPKLSGEGASDFRQNLFSLRGRGSFLPKVSGTFFLGAAETAYHGPTSQTNLDLECDLDVSWQPTERGKLTVRADRQTYFSPDGYAYIPSTLGVDWTQELAGGYSATLGADIQRIGYRFSESSRTDQAHGVYAKLKYALTGKYAVTLTADFSRQTSPELIVNYSRLNLFAAVEGRF